MRLFKKERKMPMYLYSKKEIEQYEDFIVENLGEFDEVFHEIVSPDIHLDILIIPPTEEENYYKLVTEGMGAYQMEVPEELKNMGMEHAELILYLPPTWNIKSDKEEDYWPIRQLKTVARIPIENNTWLGFGHTVSSDSKNTPYASNTKFCSMMLINGISKNCELMKLKMKSGKELCFYQLVPLYEEELQYKLEYGAEELGKLFSDEDTFPIVNIERKNYGKK